MSFENKEIFGFLSLKKLARNLLVPITSYNPFFFQECELNLANLYKSEVEFDEDYTIPPSNTGNFNYFLLLVLN